MSPFKIAALGAAGLGCAFFMTAGSVNPAHAGSCQGEIGGLSSNYNLQRGTGFLAVRRRPTRNSRMIGQLFNGEVVDIDRRRGNWLYVFASGRNGWVYARYVYRECDGI